MFGSQRIYIALLIFIFSVSISFITGYYLGKVDSVLVGSKLSSQTPPLSQAPIANTSNRAINKCTPYGALSKDDYLLTYYVQKGDTLFSILKYQNWGTAKINEFIELNKDEYPGLSLQNPFIEVGWKLYLPPKYAGTSSGKYEGVQGEILAITDSYIDVNKTPGRNDPVRINRTTWTQYVPNDFLFHKDGCVRVVYDKGYGNNRAISVVAESN